MVKECFPKRGEIIAVTKEQTQVVLDNDASTQFQALLKHDNKRIKMTVIWCFSNITAGTEAQIQLFIDAGLIPVVIKALQEGEFPTQVESAWAISNSIINGSDSQVAYAVECGVIPPLCNLLEYRHLQDHLQVTRCVLDALSSLLKRAGKDYGTVAVMIKECGGLEEIKTIRTYENEAARDPNFDSLTKIYILSSEIIKQYFPSEAEIKIVMSKVADVNCQLQFESKTYA